MSMNTRRITKTSYIGMHNGVFERVGLAFQIYGYSPPQPDVRGEQNGEHLLGNGAYVMNIINQYRADLTENQALAIIRYGVYHPLEDLKAEIQDRTPTYSLNELEGSYGEDQS